MSDNNSTYKFSEDEISQCRSTHTAHRHNLFSLFTVHFDTLCYKKTVIMPSQFTFASFLIHYSLMNLSTENSKVAVTDSNMKYIYRVIQSCCSWQEMLGFSVSVRLFRNFGQFRTNVFGTSWPASQISLSVTNIHSSVFYRASSNKLLWILLTAFRWRTQPDSSLYLEAGCFNIFLYRCRPVGKGLYNHEASRSQSDAQHSVRPSGQWSAPSRELFLTTHNTHKTQPCPPRRYSNPLSHQTSVSDLRLRPRNILDRQVSRGQRR
jgi:hypothetical protein